MPGIVKRAPVKAQYMINLYCAECGARMDRNPHAPVLQTNPPQIPYRCPNGHTASSPIPFPMPQFDLDDEAAIEFDLRTGKTADEVADAIMSEPEKQAEPAKSSKIITIGK